MNFHHLTSYNVEEAEKSNTVRVQTITCSINFLDNTSLNFIVSKECVGQYLLDLVLDYQNILEKEYFGLLYENYERNTFFLRWLSPEKKIIKLKIKDGKYVFHFNFRYYVPDPIYLQEEYTRYHFFMQLRKDLYSGHLEVGEQTLGNLGGLVLQAELEGYNPEEHTPGYTHEFNIKNPKKEYEALFVSWHKKLKDLSQADAELSFINICCQSEFYGPRLFNSIDQHRNKIQILPNHKGIGLFKNKMKIFLHKWDNIKKLDYRRKVFSIKLKNPINNPLSANSNLYESTQKFFTDTAIEAKCIWEECVSCHSFFRIRTVMQQADIINNELGGLTSHNPQNICMAIPMVEDKKPNFFVRMFSFNKKHEVKSNLRRLDRTMSSVLELRKKSKLNERGIVRSYSKRSSSRRTTSTPNTFSTLNQIPGSVPLSGSKTSTLVNQSSLERLPENRSLKTFNNIQEVDQRLPISRSKSGSNPKLSRDSRREVAKKPLSNDLEETMDIPIYKNNPKSSQRKSRSSGKNLKDSDLKKGHQNDTIDSIEIPVVSANLKREENLDNYDVDLDEETSTTIRIKQDSTRRYGFNIRGGVDHGMPIIVSRIGDNMPADLCIPRLYEGDQILSINGIDTTKLTHDEVVNIILQTPSTHSELVLVVKTRIYDPKDAAEEGVGGPDSGDAPPLPPRPSSLDVVTRYNSISSNPINGTHNSILSHASSLSGGRSSLEMSSLQGSKRGRLRKATTTGIQEKLIIDWSLVRVSGPELVESMKTIETGLVNGSIIEAFRSLDKKMASLSTTTAKLAENMSKNRYRDILPYDQTRVLLNDSYSDYINANLVKTEIPGTGKSNRYIAAQGPLTNTCGDFWLMCWEQNCSLVVMVTTNVEKGRIKCHQYWPVARKGFLFKFKAKKSSHCVEIKVVTVSEKKSKNMIERELIISRGTSRSPPSHLTSMSSINDPHEAMSSLEECRKLTQIQFTNWPDHGTPDSPKDLLELVDRMKEINTAQNANNIPMNEPGPVVVHCSAGIGRTGVLITMETARDLIDNRLPVSPIEIISKIRTQRVMLVQTEAQFQFVCEAILKYFETKYKK